MNDETLQPWMEPEFEARIIALVLGEASDFEREELERKIANSPEATLFFQRMQSLHGLLEEVNERAKPDEEWKLSEKRREHLLKTLGDSNTTPEKAVTVVQPRKLRMLSRNMVRIAGPIAATLALLLALGGLLFSSLPGLRMDPNVGYSGVDTDSISYQYSDEAPSSEAPTNAAATTSAPAARSDSLERQSVALRSDGETRFWGEKESKALEKRSSGPSLSMESVRESVVDDYTVAPEPLGEPRPEAKPAPAKPAVKNFTRLFRGGANKLRGFDHGNTNGVVDTTTTAPGSGGGFRPFTGRGVAIANGGTMREGTVVDSRSNSDRSGSTLGFPTLEDREMEPTELSAEIGELALNESGYRSGHIADAKTAEDMSGDETFSDGRRWANSPRGGMGGGGGGAAPFDSDGDSPAIDTPLSSLSRNTIPLPAPSGSSGDAGVDRPSLDLYARESRSKFSRDSKAEPGIPVVSPRYSADPFAAPVDMAEAETSPEESRLRKLREVTQGWETPGQQSKPQDANAPAVAAGSAPIAVTGHFGVASGQMPEGENRQKKLEGMEKLSEESEKLERPDERELDRKSNRGNIDKLGIDIDGAVTDAIEFESEELKSDVTKSLRSGTRMPAPAQPSTPALRSESLVDGFGTILEQKANTQEEESVRELADGLATLNLGEMSETEESGAGESKDLERNQSLKEFAKKKASPEKQANTKASDVSFQIADGREVLGKTVKFSGTTAYAGFVPLPEKEASVEPFSTFSLHVGESSFQLARAALSRSQWPERESIRVEEFVNALDYRDRIPTEQEKVAVALDQARHPFLQQRNLLRISLATAARGRRASVPLRLTLLLDNSGSMERPDRRKTVIRAFSLLLEQLQEGDEVTLISFARQPRLLADRVGGPEAKRLVDQVAVLPSEGGTNIEAALDLAFQKAKEQQVAGAQNRIILLTDGAANLGDAEPERLGAKIESFRDEGIAFDAAGIGAQGLNDEILEALTRKGDGRYYLLDRVEDADDGFARQIAGSLRPAAGNVKVQVEFNPDRVGKYHLLGFEKHRLKKEDFKNDAVDAAEMAAAEAGVALYQIEAKPEGKGDIGYISVRFRNLASGEMVEKRWPILYDPNTPPFEQAAPAIRLAATACFLGSRLKEDALGQTVDLPTLSTIMNELPSRWKRDEKVLQLQQMIQQTRELASE